MTTKVYLGDGAYASLEEGTGMRNRNYEYYWTYIDDVGTPCSTKLFPTLADVFFWRPVNAKPRTLRLHRQRKYTVTIPYAKAAKSPRAGKEDAHE